MKRDRNKGRRYRPRLADRFGLLVSTGKHLDGLWVGAFDDKPEPILRRVQEALCLIKTHDLLRYERLTRDLKRVWALPIYEPIAYFNYRLDACMLNAQFVLGEASTPELIAAAIVHEATHARLWGCGIGYAEELRPRIEAACIRRELAFSAKLPNGRQVREWAEHSLASSCDHANLTNAALNKRRDDQIIKELRRLEVPGWVPRILLGLRPAVSGVVRFAGGVARRLRKIADNGP